MPTRKADLSAISKLPIGLLAPMITPAVLKRVKERLRLTDEKLALMLVRLINPDEIIEQGEEAILRGKKDETLKGYKDEGLFPRFVNGTLPRVKGKN